MFLHDNISEKIATQPPFLLDLEHCEIEKLRWWSFNQLLTTSLIKPGLSEENTIKLMWCYSIINDEGFIVKGSTIEESHL